MLVEWACTACSCCVFAALWCIRVVAFLSSVAWDRWVTGADASVPLPERREGVSRGKIAIVGGGIAGCGAAWALARDGFEVHLFEAHATVGGNAKTHTWGDGLTTGLSVLAWPAKYFANYQRLLDELELKHTTVNISFFVRNSAGQDFEQGSDASVRERVLNRIHAEDVTKWERAVAVARSINAWFCPATAGRTSLYDMHMLNPLNILPLRWFVCHIFGVSSSFWQGVVTPVYASTFLTTNLDSVPAVILPIVHDIIPVSKSATLESWVGDSRAVFDKLTERVIVHAGEPVKDVCRVQSTQEDTGQCLWAVNEVTGFHRVVLASNAPHVASCVGALPIGHRALFNNVRYVTHDDPSFLRGIIHTDAERVLPADIKLRDHVLATHANYIEARKTSARAQQLANTFILSSWYPSASGSSLPRLVTYNADPKHSPRAHHIVGEVINEWNHPTLSAANLASLYLLRFAQGRAGIYFCGSLATPGNGHDLSLCSGLAVARAIGARYPFDLDPVCQSDLDKLASIMGL